MKLLIHRQVLEQYSYDRWVMAGHFVKYCARALSLNDGVVVHVVEDRKRYGIETTGETEDDGQTVYVYAKDRAFVDVLRTLAACRYSTPTQK